MQRYITYTRKKESDNFYSDPNTNNRVAIETAGYTTFYETCYEYNGTFLAYVEYGDSFTDEQVAYFQNLDPAYNFTFLTEEEANTFLSNLWDVSVKDFIFTDNRPLDDD